MSKPCTLFMLTSVLGLCLASQTSWADHPDGFGGWVDDGAKAIVVQAEAMSWSSKDVGALRAFFANRAKTQSFINYFLGDAGYIKSDSHPDGKAWEANLGDYRLVDLDNDGRLELVAAVDYSGRAFYTQLAVFTNKEGRIVLAEVSGWAINDLDQVIKDLDHDGRKELLLDRMPHYRGADTIPGFPDIYQYDGSTLIQVDRQFKDYYLKQQLPRIQKDLVDLRAAAAEIQKQVTTAQNKLGQEKLAAGEQESLHDELNHNTSILENCRGNIVDLQAQIDEIHRLFGN